MSVVALSLVTGLTILPMFLFLTFIASQEGNSILVELILTFGLFSFLGPSFFLGLSSLFGSSSFLGILNFCVFFIFEVV